MIHENSRKWYRYISSNFDFLRGWINLSSQCAWVPGKCWKNFKDHLSSISNLNFYIPPTFCWAFFICEALNTLKFFTETCHVQRSKGISSHKNLVEMIKLPLSNERRTKTVRITRLWWIGAIQYLRKQIEVGRWSVKCLLS